MPLTWQGALCWLLQLEQLPMLREQAVGLTYQVLPRFWADCCRLLSQRRVMLLSCSWVDTVVNQGG